MTLPCDTLAGLPCRWAQEWPQTLALADPRTTSRFFELERASRRWASAFLRAGLGPGTRIALWAGNGTQWLERAFGVWRAGATLVPISTFVTARELGEILASARPQALLLDHRVAQHHLTTVWRDAAKPSSLRCFVIAGAEATAEGWSDERFLEKADPDWALPTPLPESCAVVLYTSGTTGKPKGVQLTHANVLATIAPTAERGRLTVGDRVYSSLPLFWVAGLVIRALPTLASGAGLLLTPTFSPATCIEILRRYRPTGLHLRPPQVASLLAHPEFDPQLLDSVHRGGGRTAWYGQHLREARLITGYGMTEMSGYVTCTDADDPADERETSIGRPLPGVELRIVGPRGEEKPHGEVGEIRVRGPGLFAGYDGMPAGTGLDEYGFFCTGDLGFLDEFGALHFTGRAKDLLRVKGVNVSPVEVEEVLSRHPSIELAYVVGLPADGLDQELVALVVRRPGATATEHDWRGWCERELSVYKRPSRFLCVRREEIPFGPTSKPQRGQLARLAEEKLRERLLGSPLPS